MEVMAYIVIALAAIGTWTVIFKIGDWISSWAEYRKDKRTVTRDAARRIREGL